MFFFQEGFTFRNFVVDAFTVFVFIVWFCLLISVASDLFRRHDFSGWAKAIWVIVLIVAPYIGVLAYLIFQGRGMGERNLQQAQAVHPRGTPGQIGFSAADEIEKLDQLKKSRVRSATPNLHVCGPSWCSSGVGGRTPFFRPCVPLSRSRRLGSRMPIMRTILLIGGLALAAALTVAWDSFIGYEFFRFLELVL